MSYSVWLASKYIIGVCGSFESDEAVCCVAEWEPSSAKTLLPTLSTHMLHGSVRVAVGDRTYKRRANEARNGGRDDDGSCS
jgi:hypothetical protein